jgi:hypothetical protein
MLPSNAGLTESYGFEGAHAEDRMRPVEEACEPIRCVSTCILHRECLLLSSRSLVVIYIGIHAHMQLSSHCLH